MYRIPLRLVTIALGCILAIAAAFKLEQLLTEPDFKHPGSVPRIISIIVVEAEIAFSVWLLSGVWIRAARLCAMMCFGLFAVVAAAEGYSGWESCGCFGRLKLNPWIMVAFDLVAVAVLAFAKSDAAQPLARTANRIMAYASVAGILMAATGLALIQANTGQTSDVLGTYNPGGNLVVLEPDRWIGESFPLLKHIDIGEQLASGKWLVVLHHHDCSTCREAIPRYEQLARSTARQATSPLVALVEMPPYGSSDDQQVLSPSSCLLGKLTDQREWFATTPLVVTLEDGQVVAWIEGEQAIDPPASR